MSALTLSLILFSSIGFLLSGFFSTYLLFFKKKERLLNLLLGALLLALSLRVGKSVFYNFTSLPLMIRNMGLAANLAIGPFLWLYGKVLIQAFKPSKAVLWHFIPAALYIVFSPIIPNQFGNSLWYLSYSWVLFQQVIYLGLSLSLLKNWKLAWKHSLHKGFIILWAAISLIWFIYVLIFLRLLPLYIFGALAYSVLVIVLTYFIFQEESLLPQKEKYGASRLSPQQSSQYLVLLQEKMLEDKSFLNPDLSIQDFAQEVNISSKVISQVINEQLKLNFSAFINYYRVEEAKQRLSSPCHQQFTIASIAYDCGFNSISSFNTSFKSHVQQTPSEYRKAFLTKIN